MPNGKAAFVKLIGVTNCKLSAIINKGISIEELFGKMVDSCTDYERLELV